MGVETNLASLASKRLRLHPWRMIVERYAGERPNKLKRAIVSVEPEERYQWMRGVAGLGHGDRSGTRIDDYAGHPRRLNGRVVEHIKGEPTRAPYLTWVGKALRAPLEVWRGYRSDLHGHLEPRLYYLYAAARPNIHSMAVIVGERDGVVFNIIPFEPKDAKKFRAGELVFVAYDDPFGHCPHGCCERQELA
jgi:hypothetical protein